MLQFHRYAAHVVALGICVALGGYTSANADLPAMLRLGATNAAGMAINQGGQVGALTLGRQGTILKPIDLPTAPSIPHSPIEYVVQLGDDLQSIATKHHLTVDMIRWSNPALGAVGSVERLRVGDKLILPPVPGVVVTVKKTDTVQSLSTAYQVQPQVIIDFNYLRDLRLTEGQRLVLPGGRGPLLAGRTTLTRTGLPDIRIIASPTRSAGNPFPYGQCTWYAYYRVPVPWRGNAGEWYGNAKRAGWAVGGQAKVGAIMVTWENSYYGHVAIVDAVYTDGTWLVSEMNYIGSGISDQRVVRPGQVPLIGFIYH